MASWYHFELIQMITLAMSTGIVQAETSFNFSSFPTAKNFLVLNDTEHNPSNASFLLNLNAATMEPSCGRLLYNQTIRMKNATSGAIASFHTAFTFQIYGPNKEFVAAPVFYHGDGLAFTFFKVPILVDQGVDSGSGLCLLTAALDPFFAVEFDTFKSAAYDDSSDSHVGVNLNSMNSTWSYNLCEGKEYCSHLCNGGYFNAWIDYYSKSQILRVFLARGLNASKPEHPLIDADLSTQLAKLVDEFMYVGFSSSTGMHREVHEIKSWTFTSSMTKLATAPPSSPRPSASVSSPGSKRKRIIIGAGIAGGAVLFLVLGFFCYWKFSTGLIPLRIFISHTGGPTGSEKNFAIRLSEALKARFDVFIDREMLKGTPYPPQLLAQIEKTHMAIVVVSEEFFKRKWPMIELTKFVEMCKLRKKLHQGPATLQKEPQGAVTMHTVLPLFYTLTVAQVRSHLEEGFWEGYWTEMSSVEHPIDLEKCKEAVEMLCVLNGVEYNFRDDSHEAEYIEQILIEVDKIYKQCRAVGASKFGCFRKFWALSSEH